MINDPSIQQEIETAADKNVVARQYNDARRKNDE